MNKLSKTHRARVEKGGTIAIPPALRRRLKIRNGDGLIFEELDANAMANRKSADRIDAFTRGLESMLSE